MKIGFVAKDKSPKEMVSLIAGVARKSGHEPVDVEASHQYHERNVSALRQTDINLFTLSTKGHEARLMEAARVQLFAVCADTANGLEREWMKDASGGVPLAFTAFPDDEADARTFGYTGRIVYPGVLPHQREKFRAYSEYVQYARSIHAIHAQPLLYVSGSLRPAEEERSIVDTTTSVALTRGRRVLYRPHPSRPTAEKTQFPATIVDGKQTIDASAWSDEQAVAHAGEILYTGGGPTGSFLAAQARKPMAIVRDPRLQEQVGRDVWVVAVRKAAIDIPSIKSVPESVEYLLSNDSVRTLLPHQEKHYPVPNLDERSETTIIQELVRLVETVRSLTRRRLK